MGLVSRNASELDTGGTTRCGRCADILPDETMTFCPSCGVPFSQVSPTNSYLPLSDKHIARNARNAFHKKFALSLGVMACTWVVYGFLNALETSLAIHRLTPDFRQVDVYLYDVPGFPALDDSIKREALSVAFQSFEDHFHLPIKDFHVREDSLPDFLEEPFDDAADAMGERENVPDLKKLSISLMSFWEKKVFPPLTRKWQRSPQSPLPVLITNIPVFVDDPSGSSVETRHLSDAGIVSGLGHPALALISTYRITNSNPELAHDRPPVKSNADKAHFLGEYVIAHELGHALLGLTDYVVEPRVQISAYKKAASRSPASLSPADSHIESCLMHTDKGGGFAAWNALRNRTLGTPSECHEYDTQIMAFNRRNEAVLNLKLGNRDVAERLHQEAIDLAQAQGMGWVVQRWQEEHTHFVSFFRRWTR